MRPTKLTPDLLEAFRAVIADEWTALAFTEEELVWQANQRLPANERISYRTYQRYKAEILVEEEQGDEMVAVDLEEVDDHNNELVQQMYVTLKGALLAQKKALVRGVCEGLPNWRRYSWMLERKFPDFRLRVAPQSTPVPPQAGVDGRQPASPLGDGSTEKSNITKNETSNDSPTSQPTPADMEALFRKKWRGGPFHRSAAGWAATMHFSPEKIAEIDAEVARDLANGLIDPHAHLGYQPDPVTRQGGIYRYYYVKPDSLPVRVYYEGNEQPSWPPSERVRLRLWEEQEWERQNPGLCHPDPYNGPYEDHGPDTDAHPEPTQAPNLPPLNPPTETEYYDTGKIWGFSNGG